MKPCDLNDLNGWLEEEAKALAPEAYRRVLLEVNADLDAFVKWPERAELFWDGCHRIAAHDFPAILKSAVKSAGLSFRNWSNDPAIYAYRLTGGERPKRATADEWTIHHLYDGQFPYPSSIGPSLRAVKDSRHFTQSAGLVAVHPVADALAGEFAVFAWRLRAESFVRFGYDPQGVFSENQDEFGFSERGPVKVWAKLAK